MIRIRPTRSDRVFLLVVFPLFCVDFSSEGGGDECSEEEEQEIDV
jgi:hypothetical protein